MNDVAKKQRIEELFEVASEAASLEMRWALRDPVLWGAHVVECVASVVKLLCVGLALGLAAMYFFRLPEPVALELASIPALAVFAWNPRGWIWKNHFRLRAEAAFDQVLKTAR